MLTTLPLGTGWPGCSTREAGFFQKIWRPAKNRTKNTANTMKEKAAFVLALRMYSRQNHFTLPV